MEVCAECSSHLQVSLSDPSIGDKFSVERLGTSGRGLVSVPSIVHGAPETAEVHPMHLSSNELFTSQVCRYMSDTDQR